MGQGGESSEPPLEPPLGPRSGPTKRPNCFQRLPAAAVKALKLVLLSTLEYISVNCSYLQSICSRGVTVIN